MSRARNIKPGFFKNDLLAECSPLARILFAGLWCEADREGRLEDRPKRLKADILPYDECDINALLNDLASRGFIIRYVVEGVGYIAIPEFAKHQNPHVKEAASSIPAPGESGTSPVQAPELPERAGLIPDSPSLIPDSPIQPKQERSPKGSRLPPDWQPSLADVAFAQAERPDVDWRAEAAKFRDYWHGLAGAKGRKADWPATWRNWIRRADGKPRAGPGAMTPSRQMTAVAHLLGENVHDLASRPRPVVRHVDSPLSGELVPAEPRRLSGGGCAGKDGDALGTPSLGETSFGMD